MLFIGTPLYENKVSSQYMHGLIQTASLLQSRGLAVQYALQQGTYIAINRERLVRRFLDTDCQFFLFVDSDTAFTAMDVLGLLSADVDVVSGLYRYRVIANQGMTNHCFRDVNGIPIDTSANAPELQECGFLPTGMLMIRRSVFEALYDQHEYLFDQGFRDMSWFQKLFEASDDKLASDFEGEDIHFSRIWRQFGGKMYVKASVKVGHIGEYDYRIST